MMQHPIHLHGHFCEVVNGHSGHHPMKHTVNMLPGSKITFDLTADNPGDWAFHCHLLFHMHAGMFNVVTVRRSEEHTSELQSLMRISYAVFCLKKKQNKLKIITQTEINTRQVKHTMYRHSKHK